ncbi:MAG: J domain-containing protein [Myxococcales bacterium]|nr:J domain-containing protein [Myxococcales bacterium]MBK7192049.1 J domain-containing protein [Myxococcales bacterium]
MCYGWRDRALAVTTLARAIVALAPTKRRRLLWCAWWTGTPTIEAFRPPDAWGGGATTAAEAVAMAERAAGRPLELVDGPWAGAWRRVLAGQPPFPTRAAPRVATAAPRALDPYAVLGVRAGDPLPAVKAAFRAKVLEHHPDRGGDPEAFIAIKRAYDAILRKRLGRPAR